MVLFTLQNLSLQYMVVDGANFSKEYIKRVLVLTTLLYVQVDRKCSFTKSIR